jgi:GT2 family glycosyltransferase
MIKLLYKAAKPYIYPNLIKSMTYQEKSSTGTLVQNQKLTLHSAFKPGWYMLELQAKGSFEVANLELRFADSIGAPLVVRPNKLIKRVMYLPTQMGQASVDVHAYGDFNLSLLRLVPIKQDFAQARMLKRLSAHPLINQAKLLARLEKKATSTNLEFSQVILAAYNRLFSKVTDADYTYWVEEIEPEQLDAYELELNQQAIQIDDYWVFVDDDFVCYEGSKKLLAQFLNQHPTAVLAYADQDHLDAYGHRCKPWFKTDWNPDLFLAQDYISNCFVCKKAWYLEHQALFNTLGVKGALAVLLPSMPSSQILHLPLVLAHRRQASKQLNANADLKARAEILQEKLTLASVQPCEQGLKVSFAVPQPEPLVSLLIPTRNGLEILKACVDSILEKTSYKNFEIIILDNQSDDVAILEWFKQIQLEPKVRVLPFDYPFNYSAINNFGAQQAKGSIIGLINNDVEVISANWLTEMVAHACRPDIGCVGAKLYYSNGQIQHAGVILGLGHVAGHSHRFAERHSDGYYGRLKLVQNYSAVTAACLVVRREIYEQVGGLNERDLVVAYNDVDFCLRVRAAGYRNLWTPHAELYHHESVSRGEDDTPEKKARFDKEVAYMRATWAEELKNDPCYNPNLSRLREDFALREFV